MKSSISCIRCVDGHKMVKNGKTKSDKQRYLCKTCQKTQVESYTYKAPARADMQPIRHKRRAQRS
jgi:transposase-like protein